MEKQNDRFEPYFRSKYTAEEIESILDRLVRRSLDPNCPNCGAPITKSRCEYCGTIFTDLAEQEEKMERLRKEQAQLKIQASNAANMATLIQEYQNHESNLRSILYANNKPCAVAYTTAEASDVAAGKYFYDKSGAKVEGTASGGNGGQGCYPDGSVQIYFY